MDACFAEAFQPNRVEETSWAELVGRIVAGGYPEVLARPTAARRQAWFGAHVTTLLERDIRNLAQIAGKRFLRGILLCADSTSAAFGSNLHAMPVSALWRLDAGRAGG